MTEVGRCSGQEVRIMSKCEALSRTSVASLALVEGMWKVPVQIPLGTKSTMKVQSESYKKVKRLLVGGYICCNSVKQGRNCRVYSLPTQQRCFKKICCRPNILQRIHCRPKLNRFEAFILLQTCCLRTQHVSCL